VKSVVRVTVTVVVVHVKDTGIRIVVVVAPSFEPWVRRIHKVSVITI